MSEGDDEEGSTLVSQAAHSPSRIPRAEPPVVDAPGVRQTSASDHEPDDDAGMGTFIMGPEQHAAASSASAPAAVAGMNMLATMPTEVLELPAADPLGATMNLADGHRPGYVEAPRPPIPTAQWVDPPVVGAPSEPPGREGPDAKLMAVGALAAVLVGMFIAGVVLVMRGASPPKGESAASVAQTGPAPTTIASGAATTATLVPSAARSGPSTSAATGKPAPLATGAADPSPLAPANGAPEAAARAALAALRTGIGKCVKDVIHVLPGTSPAVPSSIAWLKSGAYAPMLNDWSTPFFACTGFRVEEPMPFVIQWQLDKGKGTGLGIAWLDDDRDGKADRAFGFTVSTKGGSVELGEIEKVDSALPVLKSL